MKRTDLDRHDREVRRMQKKQEVIARRSSKGTRGPGDFIKELNDLFYFDETKIYNINLSDEILELLEEITIEIPRDKIESILRKAVKKTGVSEKEEAVREMKELIDLD